MVEDLPTRYHQYLERFTREIGEVAVGGFAKFRGKLIKKLTFEEFTPAYIEYIEMHDRYEDSVDRGDTINDVVIKVLRDLAANLVLKPPA